MDAVDWTALSVPVVVVLGAVGYLAREVHRLDARIDARFDRAEQHVEHRFEQVDTRFDRVEQRIDGLTERYVRHLEAHAAH